MFRFAVAARSALLAIFLVLFVSRAGQALDLRPGKYKNAVVAGFTEDRRHFSLICGVHQDFPIAGVSWDNLILSLDDQAYLFTDEQPDAAKPELVMRVLESSFGRFALFRFEGMAAVAPLSKKSPPVVPADGGGFPKVPVRVVLFARLRSPFSTIPFLSFQGKSPLDSSFFRTFEIEKGQVWLDVAGRSARSLDGTVAGHFEEGDPLTLNIPDPALALRQPAFLVYDYRAGVRPREGTRKVETRGRIIANLNPNSGGSLGVAPLPLWIPMRGHAPLGEPKTLAVSQVRIGPLVLERRLVDFEVSWFWAVFFGHKASRGLEEVFRWGR